MTKIQTMWMIKTIGAKRKTTIRKNENKTKDNYNNNKNDKSKSTPQKREWNSNAPHKQ